MAGFQGSSTRREQRELLAGLIEAERRDMFTNLPGEVVSYDAKRQKAVIRPRLKQTFGDKTMQAPDLIDVPVQHPRAGGLIIHAPLKAGDEVTLHFAQRSLDEAAEQGTAADGRPGRMHDLSDAFATPSAHSKPKELTNLPADRLFIGTEDGKSGLHVKPDGTVDYVKDGDSLLAIVGELIGAFRDHLSPYTHDKVAVAGALLTRLNQLKGS